MAERRHTGISNRATPAEEQRERERIPQFFEEPPEPVDAAGNAEGEAPAAADDRQTSHKAGAHSLAEKAQSARYLDRSMPQTRKVAGAFGGEPAETPAADDEASGEREDR